MSNFNIMGDSNEIIQPLDQVTSQRLVSNLEEYRDAIPMVIQLLVEDKFYLKMGYENTDDWIKQELGDESVDEFLSTINSLISKFK